jgi:hypothetical protein
LSYQLCRWYDPYPRLAFALKLLYLAPGGLQVRASKELRRFLTEQWGAVHIEKMLQGFKSRLNGKRWYDEDVETAQTVELLRQSPEFLKSRVADTLLEILCSEAPTAY